MQCGGTWAGSLAGYSGAGRGRQFGRETVPRTGTWNRRLDCPYDGFSMICRAKAGANEDVSMQQRGREGACDDWLS